MNLNTGLTGAADFGDDFIFGANSTSCAASNYKKKSIIIRTGGRNIEIEYASEAYVSYACCPRNLNLITTRVIEITTSVLREEAIC